MGGGGGGVARLLVLSPELETELARHAAATYPDECCGVLLGRDDDGVRVVERLLPIANRWEPGRQGDRFLIEPRDVLAAERAAQRAGLDVVGFYHSHPDSPAVPSTFDREHAWPWYSYLIAAVHAGRQTDLLGWELRDDRSGYEPVAITSDVCVG